MTYRQDHAAADLAAQAEPTPAPRRLCAVRITVQGRRHPLLEPTSLCLHAGELVVAHSDPGHGHTALALCLAGRLRPDGGAVELDGARASLAVLQSAVALVDVPGVSEPDGAVPALTVVGEELAMAGRRATGRGVAAWLVENQLEHVRGRRTDELVPADRVVMLSRLAALRRPEFLVLTLPERHGGRPADWLPGVAALAAGGLGVLVTAGSTTAAHLRLPAAARSVAFPDSFPDSFADSEGADDTEEQIP